jgi:hypothetical protein
VVFGFAVNAVSKKQRQVTGTLASHNVWDDMIHLDELWVMQQCVDRGSEQINGMIQFIRDGGV